MKSRTDLAEHKLPFAQDHPPVEDFLSAIKTFKPTAIIGVAAVHGTFNKEVLEEMARINERPIIFALSNPTSPVVKDLHLALTGLILLLVVLFVPGGIVGWFRERFPQLRRWVE